MAYSIEATVVLPVTAIVLVTFISLCSNSVITFIRESSCAVESLKRDMIRSTGAQETDIVVLIETVDIIVDLMQ